MCCFGMCSLQVVDGLQFVLQFCIGWEIEIVFEQGGVWVDVCIGMCQQCLDWIDYCVVVGIDFQVWGFIQMIGYMQVDDVLCRQIGDEGIGIVVVVVGVDVDVVDVQQQVVVGFGKYGIGEGQFVYCWCGCQVVGYVFYCDVMVQQVLYVVDVLCGMVYGFVGEGNWQQVVQVVVVVVVVEVFVVQWYVVFFEELVDLFQ